MTPQLARCAMVILPVSVGQVTETGTLMYNADTHKTLLTESDTHKILTGRDTAQHLWWRLSRHSHICVSLEIKKENRQTKLEKEDFLLLTSEKLYMLSLSHFIFVSINLLVWPKSAFRKNYFQIVELSPALDAESIRKIYIIPLYTMDF